MVDLVSDIRTSLLVVNQVVNQRIAPLETKVVEKQVVKEKPTLANLNDSSQLNKLKQGKGGILEQAKDDDKKAKPKKKVALEGDVRVIKFDNPAPKPGSQIDLKA